MGDGDIRALRKEYQRQRRVRLSRNLAWGALLLGVFLLALWPLGAEVALLAATVLMLVRKHFDVDFHFRRLPMDLPVGLFVLLSGASIIVSPDRGFSFYNWYNLVVVYLLIYLTAGQLVRSVQQFKQVFLVLGASAVLCVLYGLWQWAFGIDVSDVLWVDPQAFPELTKRIFSTWVNPNIFAGYLDAALCLTFAFLVKAQGREKRVVLGVLLAAMLACLALTYARGALLVLAIIVAGYGLLRDWRVLAVFVVLAVGALAFDPVLLDRLGSVFTKMDTSAEMRLAFWEATLAMIGDHPFLGIGWGAYWLVYPSYDFYMQGNFIKIVHAHNLYLNYAAEIGLPGALAFFWFFFGTMVVSLRARFRAPEPLPAETSPFTLQAEGLDGELQSIQMSLQPPAEAPAWEWQRLLHWSDAEVLGGATLGIGLALISVALNGFTDDLLFNIPTSMFLWLLAGLAGALAHMPGYRGWVRHRPQHFVPPQPSLELDKIGQQLTQVAEQTAEALAKKNAAKLAANRPKEEPQKPKSKETPKVKEAPKAKEKIKAKEEPKAKKEPESEEETEAKEVKEASDENRKDRKDGGTTEDVQGHD